MCFALAAGPAACATRPGPPWLDALNLRPYLSSAWAGRRLSQLLSAAKTISLSLCYQCDLCCSELPVQQLVYDPRRRRGRRMEGACPP